MKDIHTKQGNLIIAQSDNISGEIIGAVIEQLYRAGAHNVQVIPTVTKKNRTGFLFVIDAKEASVPKIEEVVFYEIGATGWHCLKTEHRHVAVEILEKTAEICVGDTNFQFVFQAKWTPEDPDFYRPEYECCAALKQKILDMTGRNIPLKNLYRIIEHAFSEQPDNITIKI